MDNALLFGQSADWWNGAMLVSLSLAAFVAFIVAAATTGAVIAAKREAVAATAELERYKADAAARIAEAHATGDAAKAEAAKAQLALAMFKAPRAFNPTQLEAMAAAAATHKGTVLHVFVAGISDDTNALRESLVKILETGGQWHVEHWAWSGIGPVTGIMVIVSPNASPQNVAAATDLLRAIGGPESANRVPQVWPGEWEKVGGMLNGGTFNAGAAEIRVIIGSKPTQ